MSKEPSPLVVSAKIDGQSTSHDRILRESTLKERFEAKLEEYRDYGTSTIDYDAGVVQGLTFALEILEDL